MSVPSTLPIRSQIRIAVEYALRNRIVANGEAIRYSSSGNSVVNTEGYYHTIGEVVSRPKQIAAFTQYPGVNVFIESETCEDVNNVQIEQNTGLLSNSFLLVLECFVSDSNDPQLAIDKLLCDLQKYFGINYYIPDESGNATAMTCYYDSSESGCFNTGLPNSYLVAKFRVWYRQKNIDPSRSS